MISTVQLQAECAFGELVRELDPKDDQENADPDATDAQGLCLYGES